jgi:prophage regulatory protein
MRFLTRKQVRERTTLSFTEIVRKENAGKFPKRVRLGPSRVAYLESEVEAWIEERLAESRKTTSGSSQ